MVPRVGRLAPERRAPAAAVAGGLMVTGGAFLPWLSFYAGLYPMRGVIGPWGRLLAAAGVVCAALGAWALRRPTRRAEWALAVLGCAATGFSAWLLVQLGLTFERLLADPMVVPRLGPGLFVVFAGAVAIALPAVLRMRRRRAAAPASPDEGIQPAAPPAGAAPTTMAS